MFWKALFHRVIIIGAERFKETETTPCIVKNCRQLVMIGSSQKAKEELGRCPNCSSLFDERTISLFERLIKEGMKPEFLNIQYRMHSSISMFPNFQFYSGDSKLRNNLKENLENLVFWNEYLSSSISFFDLTLQNGEPTDIGREATDIGREAHSLEILEGGGKSCWFDARGFEQLGEFPLPLGILVFLLHGWQLNSIDKVLLLFLERKERFY